MRPPDLSTDPHDGSPTAALLWGPTLVAVIALALLVPIVDLDPVRGVTASNSPFSDEVWNVLNARNLVLLGTWSTDEWNLHLLNGPFSLVEAAVFAALGVGIVQARLVAIGCTALAGAAIVLGLQRWVGRLAAIVAALAFVTATLALFYGRLAYVEPLTGSLLVSGTLTLTAADRRPGRWGFAAGLAFALAIASKALAIPFVGVVVLAAGVLGMRDAELRHWFAGATVALVGAAVTWGLVVWLPHRDEVAFMVTHVLPQLHFDPGLPAVRRTVGYLTGSGDDGAIARSLPLLLGAAVGAVVAARNHATIPKRALVLYGIAAAGCVASLIVIAAASYHPNRYVVPFLPVAALLVGPLVQAVRSWLAAWRPGPALPLVGPALLVVVLCAPGLVQLIGWTAAASRTLPALQAAGLDAFPRGQVVAGPYSALVAFRAPVVALVTAGADPSNPGDLYLTRGARYVVSGSTPPEWVFDHPAAWDARQRLFCFVWDVTPQQFCAYRLP